MQNSSSGKFKQLLGGWPMISLAVASLSFCVLFDGSSVSVFLFTGLASMLVFVLICFIKGKNGYSNLDCW